MRLIFATNNINKINEVKAALHHGFDLITLQQAGIHIDIPEPHHTLEENATEKSGTIYRLTGSNCFSEDTGLEVAALQGAPGVYSARYAGPNATDDENIRQLLSALAGHTNRSARFRTVISLILNGTEKPFEGICEGRIITEKTGTNGFGYDPVFIPNGANTTFAQMSMDEKKAYSHRSKALQKLVLYLNNYTGV